jgi:hypothetical protein
MTALLEVAKKNNTFRTYFFKANLHNQIKQEYAEKVVTIALF